VEINGTQETVHVKNTGRCRELLTPGAEVWCQQSDNPARKTKYDLIAVRKGARLINMDSQAPNDGTDPQFGSALREAAAAGVTVLAMDCQVTVDSMTIQNPVPVIL
jgi:sugar fermentation stimulation protein A